MTNVTRQPSNAVNTELIYYVVQYYDDFVADRDANDSLPITAADVTCRLITSVDKQQAAIILGYVIVTLCHGLYLIYYYYYYC